MHLKTRKLIFYLSISLLVGAFFVWENNKLNLQSKTPEEINNYIIAKMTNCHQNDNSDKCYKINAEDFINQFKLSEIMAVFYQNEKTPEFFSKCHLTAHYLGQIAYKRYRGVAAVFSEANHACLGGLYHGAVEGYFIAQNITDIKDNKIKQQIKNVCGTAKDYDDPQKFTECNHGLGHAMMYLTENDLLEALDLCDALSSFNEQGLCYTGALMANADSFKSTDHPTKYIKEDDLLYPCPILKKHHQGQCYTYGVLSRFQNDIPKAISICLKVPAEFQSSCFETFGRDRTMLSADPEELKSQCYQIKKGEFIKNCIAGTSYNLVIRFGINSKIPIDYCEITELEYKSSCYTRVFGALNNISKDKEVIKNFCEQIGDENYKNKCLNSI